LVREIALLIGFAVNSDPANCDRISNTTYGRQMEIVSGRET